MGSTHRFLAWFAVALMGCLASFPITLSALEAPPGRIHFQGMARDSAGHPLEGPVAMIFRFYDDPGAGTLLWQEVYDPIVYPPAVAVSEGLFTVALGDPAHRNGGSEATFQGLFSNHGTVYMGVQAGTDPEMTPRIPVASTPFALNADALDGKRATDFAGAMHGHAGSEIAGPVAEAGNSDTLDGQHAAAFAVAAHAHDAAAITTGTVSAARGGTGLASPGASGNVLTSTGSAWTSSAPPTGATGAVVDAANTTLTRSGAGTAGNPYKLALNLANANTWSGAQTFSANTYFPGSGIWTSSGKVGIGTTAAQTNALYVEGSGNVAHFKDISTSGSGGLGVTGYGRVSGGYFNSSGGGLGSYVGYGTYKILGSGTVSFVQNHPTVKDKVIVYACPEGDEVATYTRGTAKLVNGEARVALGETFRWVTNPDLGLTAHLTPRGEAVPLAVESLSTTELVVHGPAEGPREVTFDYLVYGLRIGFEESSIVQEKQKEAYIPSFKEHRERYAKYPELRGFSAFERFKGMESAVRGVSPESLDLSRAKALKDAVHEYDPATDPPADELTGHGPGPLPRPSEAGLTANRQAPEPMRFASPDSLPVPDIVGRKVSDQAAQALSTGSVPSPAPERYPVCETVEAGDVLVNDAARPGAFCLSRIAADAGVVGIATGGSASADNPQGNAVGYPLVPLATSGIVTCKADATYGPISPNDLLVASPTPGHAMRAQSAQPGTVIGKALEPLQGGTGLIRILVMFR